jgi:hypothetical protein
MANKYFNKQVAESRKPYKHGICYVYAVKAISDMLISPTILPPKDYKTI